MNPRRPLGQKPPTMVRNDDLLRELIKMRKELRDIQDLKGWVIVVEPVIPKSHHSGKRPIDEGKPSSNKDQKFQLVTPRNVFVSGDQVIIGGNFK